LGPDSGVFDSDKTEMGLISEELPTNSFQGLPGRKVLTSIQDRTALLVPTIFCEDLVHKKHNMQSNIIAKMWQDESPFIDMWKHTQLSDWALETEMFDEARGSTGSSWTSILR
jgi:hypothetical protein